MSERCCEVSLASEEPLAATATTAERWLLLEVPGAWPRDVADASGLSDAARAAVDRWLAAGTPSRVQFIRRPGRTPERLLAFVVASRERAGGVRRFELASHSDLARLDLETSGERVDGSLVLVCGHGSRDRCCALFGTPVYAALAERLGEEEVWLSSHQGGHRFAANVLVLPAGLQFGRLPPENAPLVAARALAGRIDLDRYRGRTCYPVAVQAAEIAVRREAGLEGVGDLELRGVEDGVVRLRIRNGAEYSVELEQTEGPSVPASCGESARPQRHFRPVSLMQLRAGVSAEADTRRP
jgi:hypothetical protein